jgi:hypothetical protein
VPHALRASTDANAAEAAKIFEFFNIVFPSPSWVRVENDAFRDSFPAIGRQNICLNFDLSLL